MFDFDDGSLRSNTLGRATGGISSTGLGPDEAMLTGLDSGGPSFVPMPAEPQSSWRRPIEGQAAAKVEWQIAGIHAGIDRTRNSQPGGVALDTVVAPHAGWISTLVGPQVLGR